MGSAFLCAALGIVPTVRHADYIGSWLEVLREDNRAIFRAAGAASKAADWLLSRLPDAGRDEDIGDTIGRGNIGLDGKRIGQAPREQTQGQAPALNRRAA